MPANNDHTVFISYRRSSSSYVARAIFMDLHMHGYDVFMDVESIGGGHFDTRILNQIAARAHFVLILARGTLDRITEPDDWLRREIEHAIILKRNVVPILVDGFEFKDYQALLTGTLAELPRFNGPTLYHEYFDAAMERLRANFLKQPVEGEVMPVPDEEQADAARKVEQITSQPKPTEDQISAEEHFNRGYELAEAEQYDAALDEYNRAIALNPEFPEAYNNRGTIHMQYEDYQAAIEDFTRSIEMGNTQPHLPYTNRADARVSIGDYESALKDANRAIEHDPEFTSAYHNRGRVYFYTGQLMAAHEDFSRVLELDPKLPIAYVGRGAVRAGLGDMNGAINDFDRALELDPSELDAHNNRAEAYFQLDEFEKAREGFAAGNMVRPGNTQSLAGLAVSYHALGNTREARRLWRTLINMDGDLGDPDTAQQKLNWPDKLAAAVQEILEEL